MKTIELDDGGCLERDHEGTIRRRDQHGNCEERRDVGDPNYQEWRDRFPPLKPCTRKFYRRVITITVLSEDTPISDDLSIREIDYAITEGDCSGQTKFEDPVLLTAKEAAVALREQTSDPLFFRIDDDGNELE